MTTTEIPGYRYADPSLPPASLSAADLDRLRQSLLLDDGDIALLREARSIVEPHVDELLDTWYRFIGAHDFLVGSFVTPSGPDANYLARVRGRFGQWVLDTLDAKFDDAWLAYQAEIGRRHSVTKNQTDNVSGAPDVVPFRYLVPLVYPVFATMRPILARGVNDPEKLDRMHQAWLKAVLLSVTLWSEPYVRDGWF